jgi:hypothetical protein
MIRTLRSISLAAVAALLVPAALHAQSSLSVLGFGFPSGQLSTRALGTGGALGEIDPLSVTNPAVIGAFGGSILYFQIEPEYRRLHVGANTQANTIARYPLISAAFPVSQTLTFGLSASNFLDRSFETQTRGTAVFADTVIGTGSTFSSDGSIGDLRLAGAYAPRTWLRLGLAAHAIVGDNRIKNVQRFDDSTRFAALIDTATIGYTGNAYSAGFEVLLGRQASVAGSYRRGGSLSLKRGDTTVSKANVPDRLAMSLAYVGIRGTTIAVRTAKDTWSRMQSLGGPALFVTDSWDTSVGADVLGPRVGNNTVQLRTGARWRTLPFGLATGSVSENTYSLGAGTAFGRGGRAALDIATFHSSRSANAAPTESAWTLSIGLTVRP